LLSGTPIDTSFTPQHASVSSHKHLELQFFSTFCVRAKFEKLFLSEAASKHELAVKSNNL